MKTIKNEKLIKRNSKIGNWSTMGGIVVLGGAMYATFRYPASSQLLIYTAAAFIIGLILTQVGMYMSLRFVRSPRPDEKLDAGLKGLPNEFVIYHYTTPVSHLLVGPAGVWVIMPYHQVGRVTFTKNRWRLSGGGFLQGYLRIFGQEGIGRPDIEVEAEVSSLRKYLTKHVDEAEIPEVNALMVFTNDNVELDVEETPIPSMKVKQLKEFMRQKAKEKKVSAEKMNQVKALFE